MEDKSIKIKKSELILNADGSIYHLQLRPENIAHKIITVGNPDRVEQVSKHFDSIDFKKQSREFKTHTGRIGKKRISVISTGIGADNIDIVLNELDALVNIDFNKRVVKNSLISLEIVRIGTSGAIQNYIELDSIILSSYGLDLSGLLEYYQFNNNFDINSENYHDVTIDLGGDFSKTLMVGNCRKLEKKLFDVNIQRGITATCAGFYGPQGRQLRLIQKNSMFLEKFQKFNYRNLKITNFEMETAAIYGLSKLLGHKACSLNAILANRIKGTFSKNPEKAINKLIKHALTKLIG